MKIFFGNNRNNKTGRPDKKGDPSLYIQRSTADRIDLNLWGVKLSVSRDTTLDVPSELSVIIPRVELRQKYTPSPSPAYETEIIISSVTVVLSPRHAPEKSMPAP
ncbi:MAG: hypothetical protein QHH10_13890 [Peptococcaceae bacterium]|jgi:subtilisin-like proprotein convertase family protein|nr:hypothetical protein [Peptococcaceae bacterium]MDH7526386.1 hypothetical protein [Peptococcaceae bacterium]